MSHAGSNVEDIVIVDSVVAEPALNVEDLVLQRCELGVVSYVTPLVVGHLHALEFLLEGACSAVGVQVRCEAGRDLELADFACVVAISLVFVDELETDVNNQGRGWI